VGKRGRLRIELAIPRDLLDAYARREIALRAMAARLGVSYETVRKRLKELGVSLHAPGASAGHTLWQTPEVLARREMVRLMRARGMLLKDIARRLGVSHQRVLQILNPERQAACMRRWRRNKKR
jgi:DNA-binding CsgD family transcriptional regulator